MIDAIQTQSDALAASADYERIESERNTLAFRLAVTLADIEQRRQAGKLRREQRLARNRRQWSLFHKAKQDRACRI
jgi:hypothetical protein